MFKKVPTIFLLLCSTFAYAQEEAVTASGRVVLLFPDSTWKFKPQPIDSAQVAVDSVRVQPEKPKPYTETATGFKGFLKPELSLAELPPRSNGLYAFKVKVNKEGMVKEVVTLQRGPNGETEIMIRNAIARMKFLWDNSIVPPLTEGVIKVNVTGSN